jgi:mono/diheme cytochrome c family protein
MGADVKKARAFALALCAFGAALGGGAFFFAPHRLDPVSASGNALTGQALVDRGRYLAIAGDCTACHTAPGGKPFAGGLPFNLPFGTIYSPNITPDEGAGIGSWNAAEFVRAMRHGVGKDGRDLYPAFPYTSYASLQDDDMLAIFAYLKSLTPVSDQPPASKLRFPFNQRWTLRGWKFFFLGTTPYRENPDKSAEWNRGAYLVQGLAHCGECHTPRNLALARKQSKELSGGDVDGWKAWNITPDAKTGIGNWTADALADYLSTGSARGHGSATGSMREAIDLSFSKLEPSDIQAIVTYVRSLSPIRTDGPEASASPPTVLASTAWSAGDEAENAGRTIFAGACASCHGWDGRGQATPRQALQGDRSVADPEGANLVRLLLQGSRDLNDDPSRTMPSFAAAYSDSEIAAVSNYVIQHFGGTAGKVTQDQVKAARGANQN